MGGKYKSNLLPVEEISKKYIHGISSGQLAREYKVDPVTILNVLRNNRVSIRTAGESTKRFGGEKISESFRIKTQLNPQNIIEKYISGYSLKKLAEEVNSTPWIVRQSLRRLGVPIRTRGQANRIFRKGLKLSEETKKKISESHKSKRRGLPIDQKTLRRKILRLPEYKEWRNIVFKRDNWVCQRCFKRGIGLQAHHINRVENIIKVKDLHDLTQALACKDLWDIDNGKTLCLVCHRTEEWEAYRRESCRH